MLNVYYGSDTNLVRQKALELLSKNGGAVERVEAGSYTSGVLASAVGSTQLFGESACYLIDNPTEKEEFFNEYLSLVKELASSNVLFVVIEKTVLAAAKKKLEAAGASLEEYKKGSTETFNIFSMADSLATKDKRGLWLLLQEAKAEGLVSEEIVGTLWWQLKTMRLAARAKTAAEVGLKDFPFKKAKAALIKFPLIEVEKKSRELLRLSHESRRGLIDLDLGLEAWVLSL
jgi:DNA polymerase III delta subunit